MTATRRQAGFTLMEVALATGILAIALVGLVGAMSVTVQQGRGAAERTIAMDAARRKMEEILAFCDSTDATRGFSKVFAAYNAITSDDAGVDVTGRGATFSVHEFNTRGGRLLEARVIFPTNTGGTLLAEQATALTSAQKSLLGMPRDLNGDGDDEDALSAGFLIVPVMVRIRWRSTDGPKATDESVYELCALLARRA